MSYEDDKYFQSPHIRNRDTSDGSYVLGRPAQPGPTDALMAKAETLQDSASMAVKLAGILALMQVGVAIGGLIASQYGYEQAADLTREVTTQVLVWPMAVFIIVGTAVLLESERLKKRAKRLAGS